MWWSIFRIKIIVLKLEEENEKGKQVEGSSNTIGIHTNPIVVDNDSQQPEASKDEDRNIELVLEVAEEKVWASLGGGRGGRYTLSNWWITSLRMFLFFILLVIMKNHRILFKLSFFVFFLCEKNSLMNKTTMIIHGWNLVSSKGRSHPGSLM